MKIIGVGLIKTGTSSLHHALRMMGYTSLHSRWDTPAGEGPGRVVLPNDLTSVDAISDINAASCFEVLDLMYPRSRFVYTVREIEAWLESVANHVYYQGWAEGRKEAPTAAASRSAPQDPDGHALWVYHRLTWGEDKPREFDRDWWAEAYWRHDRRVRSYFEDRPGDLLVYDICGGEEWKPLCGFLRRPVPVAPFPHEERGRYPWRLGVCPKPEGLEK